MKKNLNLMAMLVIAVLVCSGALALTSVSAELRSTSIKRVVPAPLVSFLAPMTQDVKSYRQDVAKVLKRHDSVELDPQRVAEQVRATGKLSLPTAEGVFELNLAPYDMLAPNYRAQVTLDGGEVRPIERGPVRTYKGTVVGRDGSQARLTIDENTLEGLIILPSRLIFVEPAKRYSNFASSKDFLVYNDSDVIQTSYGECGVTMAEKVGAEAARIKSEVPTSLAQTPGTEEVFSPSRVVDLATEADFEYFTFFGSNEVAAKNEIISIINQVDGIYNTQFGLRFSIVFQNVWATSSDPFTTANSDDALDQFRDYWNANHGAVARDLAHMWTGKDFEGETIGIAFRPGLDCPLGPFSYGMSERVSNTPAKFLLTAHEIGHNFNATHTDEPVAQAGCDNTIMESSLGSSTLQQFCPFSVTQIENHANGEVACLSQATTPGCSYSLSPSSQAFSVGGGSGTTNLTTTGTGCAWGAVSSVGWISVTSAASGTDSATINYTVAANNAGFARMGVIRVADQNFTVFQEGGSCPVVPIIYGQTINGSLSPDDCSSSRQTFTKADQYSFSGAAGDQIRIEMTSTASPVLDTYLFLIGPAGTVVAENDDINFGVITNSRIPVSGFFTLPVSGTYIIESTAFDSEDNQNELGSYTLSLTPRNPIDGSQFFVTKHYEDFLRRQPDAGGLQFWTNNIESCGLPCRQDRRVDTSAAFFLSIEFQETGFLVYRMYRAAYGETQGQAIINGVPTAIPVPIVRRQEFIPDLQRIGMGVIVGTPGWPELLESNKVAYAQEFVAKARFTTAFPTNMSPRAFVDALNATAGNVLSTAEGDNLVAELTAAGNSSAGRASVLRKVAEDPTLVAAEFNKAFVLMQYFGYLQRNPNDTPDTDHSGYKFWLDKLNQFNGDFRQSQMVTAFILSLEYRNRFGP